MLERSYNKAFTLAEVLITLGIVGIVAALTLPTLISNYRAKVYETAFKKSYNNISKALSNTKMELGVSNLVENYNHYDFHNNQYTNANEFFDAFYNELEAEADAKSYYISNYNNTKNFLAASIKYAHNDMPVINKILKDGSAIGISITSGKIYLFIDTNGYKKPNRFGIDIFKFYISKKDMVIPIKMSKLYTEEELEDQKYPAIVGDPCSVKSNQALNGTGCSYYAMNDINPDDNTKSYWKNLPR